MDIFDSAKTILEAKTASSLMIAVFVLTVNLFMNLIFLRWIGQKLVVRFDKIVTSMEKKIRKHINDPRLVAIWQHETMRARKMGHTPKDAYYCADGNCGLLRKPRVI